MIVTMKLFYVYALLNSTTMQPFYIGKGKGRRMYAHARDARSKHKTTGEWLNTSPHHVYIRELEHCELDIAYQVLFETSSEAQALAEEKRLIAKHGRVINNTGILLNISRGGNRGGETCKPVTQYTKDGIKVATHPSCLAAGENVPGANKGYIASVCKGKRRSAGGFLWTYEGAPAPVYFSEQHRAVDQYDATGTFIQTYRSVSEAAKVAMVDVRTLSKTCMLHGSSGGYIWRYNGEPLGVFKTPNKRNHHVYQYDKDGNFIAKHESVMEASAATKVGISHIRQVCDSTHRAQTAGGYIWNYSDVLPQLLFN